MIRESSRIGCVVGLWAGIVAQFLTAHWFQIQVSTLELWVEIPFVTLVAVGAIVLGRRNRPVGDGDG